MAYFIFLKSLRSPEEFRKNPLVKIPPKSPCANFQSFGIFKNQILFRKEFSPSLSAHLAFRPSLFFLPADFPSPSHWASASRLAQPTCTAQPTTFFFLPHRSRACTAPPPAGLLPPPQSPRHLHQKRKTAVSNPPSFPPLIGAIPPLFNPGNRCLQPCH
jgi:hypothetical protein